MTAKQLFLQKNETVKNCNAMVKSADFETLCLYARSHWIDTHKNWDAKQVAAVNDFLAVLLDLPNDEPSQKPFPRPKIHHDLDVAERQPKKPQKV
jgi:hypothetical protein